MEYSYLLLKNLGSLEFQLISDYIYATNEYIINVPKGFVTDFATIPRIMRIFVLPYGKHNSAAVIHDWLYCIECNIVLTRKEADKIFLEIMLENKINKIMAYFMYIAVRLFGMKYYKNKKI